MNDFQALSLSKQISSQVSFQGTSVPFLDSLRLSRNLAWIARSWFAFVATWTLALVSTLASKNASKNG
jgi:hypothetical protein